MFSASIVQVVGEECLQPKKTIVRVRLVPSPDELSYKEDRVRRVELMPCVNPASKDQPSVDTEADQPESSHEEDQLEQPTKIQFELPLPQEQVEQPVMETNSSLSRVSLVVREGRKDALRRQRGTSPLRGTGTHGRIKCCRRRYLRFVPNLMTMVHEQHNHLSQRIDDLRKFIERLCQGGDDDDKEDNGENEGGGGDGQAKDQPIEEEGCGGVTKGRLSQLQTKEMTEERLRKWR